MHVTAEFHVQFQLLEVDWVTDPFLLCVIHFQPQNKNCGCVYLIEPIHTADEVSLIGPYLVAANWILMQAILECHQHHHGHSCCEMLQCHSAGTLTSSLLHVKKKGKVFPLHAMELWVRGGVAPTLS
jgi:hypothetical protein